MFTVHQQLFLSVYHSNTSSILCTIQSFQLIKPHSYFNSFKSEFTSSFILCKFRTGGFIKIPQPDFNKAHDTEPSNLIHQEELDFHFYHTHITYIFSYFLSTFLGKALEFYPVEYRTSIIHEHFDSIQNPASCGKLYTLNLSRF